MEPQPKVSSEKESSVKEMSFRNLLVNFMGYTTAHGVGRFADSKTIFWKLFWIGACLGALGMFVYQAYGLFMLYLSRPVVTSVTVTFKKRLEFPAVTVCNLNMIRNDAMPENHKKAMRDRFNYRHNKTTTEDSNRERRRRETTSEDEVKNSKQPEVKVDDVDYNNYKSDATIMPTYGPEGLDDVDDDYPDAHALDETMKIRIQLAQIIGEMDTEKLSAHGHLFSNMIKNCSWKGLDCKSRNFSKHWTRSWNYKYGNCYTFNNGADQENNPVQVLKSSKPGPLHGLILDINVEQDKYIGPLTIEAGVRVVLHHQGNMPFPYEEGFSVSPGTSASVGLKKSEINRLNRFQNSTCWPQEELPKENLYRLFKNITHYSQQACLNSCLGLSQWFRCQCSEDVFPSPAAPCDVFNATTRACLKIVQHLFNNDKLQCIRECKQPCSYRCTEDVTTCEAVIRKTISSSKWPSEAYQSYLASEGVPRNGNSFLLLNIFYNELNYEKVEEKFSYGQINLLADIGGQLGLWIGISVITCCEVVELFMMIFGKIIKKCLASRKTTQVREIRVDS